MIRAVALQNPHQNPLCRVLEHDTSIMFGFQQSGALRSLLTNARKTLRSARLFRSSAVLVFVASRLSGSELCTRGVRGAWLGQPRASLGPAFYEYSTRTVLGYKRANYTKVLVLVLVLVRYLLLAAARGPSFACCDDERTIARAFAWHSVVALWFRDSVILVNAF